MPKQLETILYEILEVSDSTNLYSLADDIIIISLIFLNIASFIASTSPNLTVEYQHFFENIEI